MISKLREQNVTHLAVDSRIVPAYRPTLYTLLSGRAPSENLTLLKRLTDRLGQVLLIYRVRPIG